MVGYISVPNSVALFEKCTILGLYAPLVRQSAGALLSQMYLEQSPQFLLAVLPSYANPCALLFEVKRSRLFVVVVVSVSFCRISVVLSSSSSSSRRRIGVQCINSYFIIKLVRSTDTIVY